MADRQLHTLLEGGAFFESPRWHDGRWWVSDFYCHLVLSVSATGEPREVLEVEEQPSGLGWMPDGSMLVVSMRDHRILRWSTEAGVTEHADVSEYCGGHLNDVAVDARGRAYVGNFGFDLMGGGDPAPANLIRVDPDGSASIAAEELLFPNGSVITSDGKTLIVGETAGARYTTFTINDDGSLSDRRVWAQVAPTPEITTLAETLTKLQFGPDGCGLDAENHIWCADEVNARCVRDRPGRRHRRRDQGARWARRLRVHARRRRRPDAAHVRRAGFRRGQPHGRARSRPAHDHGRRPPTAGCRSTSAAPAWITVVGSPTSTRGLLPAGRPLNG